MHTIPSYGHQLTTLTSAAAALFSIYGHLTPLRIMLLTWQSCSAYLQTRRTCPNVHDDITNPDYLVRWSASIPGEDLLGRPHLSMVKDYPRYYHVRSYITRKINECNVIATEWVNADNQLHENGFGAEGLYFIMESLTSRTFSTYSDTWSFRFTENQNLIQRPYWLLYSTQWHCCRL